MKGVKTLPLTLNEFKVFYNAVMEPIRPESLIRHIEVFERDGIELFFIKINQRSAFFGQVDRRNGSIRQLGMVKENDGTSRTKLEFLLAVAALLETIKPKCGRQEKSRVLEKMQFFRKDVDIYNFKCEGQYDDLMLTYLSSVEAGIFSLHIAWPKAQ